MIPYWINKRTYGKSGAVKRESTAFLDVQKTKKAYHVTGFPGAISPVIKTFPSGNRAMSVSALPIWTTPYYEPNAHPSGWNRVNHTDWVRAHLVHGEMGGPGTVGNLVATPQQVNKNMYLVHEKYLVDALRTLKPEDRRAYWFNATVTWRTDSDSTHEVVGASDFPRGITVEYGEAYLPEGGVWQADGKVGYSSMSYPIRLPYVSELLKGKGGS
jgi:hypothetical protein